MLLRTLLPKEHGAYIALIVGCITGIGCAHSFTSNTLLIVLAIAFAYLSHAPLLQWLKQRGRQTHSALLMIGASGLVIAAICTLPLMASRKYFGGFVIAGGIAFALSLLL